MSGRQRTFGCLSLLVLLVMAVGVDASVDARIPERVVRKCAKRTETAKPGVDTLLCRHFRVFRRRRTPADRPWKNVSAPARRFGRPRLSASRRLPGRRGIRVQMMVVPTRRGYLCMYTRAGDTYSIGCGKVRAVIRRRPLWYLSLCSDHQPARTFILYMILPDTAREATLTTADSSETRLSIRQNRILALLPRRERGDLPKEITWRTPRGPQALNLRWLPPEITEDSCGTPQ
jgi:hypothetical protein